MNYELQFSLDSLNLLDIIENFIIFYGIVEDHTSRFKKLYDDKKVLEFVERKSSITICV